MAALPIFEQLVKFSPISRPLLCRYCGSEDTALVAVSLSRVWRVLAFALFPESALWGGPRRERRCKKRNKRFAIQTERKESGKHPGRDAGEALSPAMAKPRPHSSSFSLALGFTGVWCLVKGTSRT
jgi:hypothetical protein